MSRQGYKPTDPETGRSGASENAPFSGISEAEPMGVIEVLAFVGSVFLLVITFPISVFLCFKVVQEYERAVIFRLGRLRQGGARGPGIFFILPCIDNYCKVDLRTVSFDVPPQEVLTKDSVTVTVDAVVYYRVDNPLSAVNNVSNYSHSTRLLAATTLRNVLGTRNLSEILSERETISHTMQSSLDEATDPWGVKVERVEIKDVRLPQQLQRAMAAEAEAAREARAKVIAAGTQTHTMKSFVVTLVVLAVFAVAQAALDKEKSIQLIKKCKAEANATEDPEELFTSQSIPTTREGKCMMACVLREKGLMKGDKVDAQAVSDFFEKTYADDPEQLEKAAAAVGICSTIDVKGLDKCEVAVAYLKCGQEHDFKL